MSELVGVPVRSIRGIRIRVKPNARMKKARRTTYCGLFYAGTAVVNGKKYELLFNIYTRPLRVRVYLKDPKSFPGFYIVNDEDVEVIEALKVKEVKEK